MKNHFAGEPLPGRIWLDISQRDYELVRKSCDAISLIANGEPYEWREEMVMRIGVQTKPSRQFQAKKGRSKR